MNSFSDLEAKQIKSNLDGVLVGSEVMLAGETGSTNDLAREYLRQGAAEGLVVIAESQTGGRGRRGRSWYSAPGLGIYCSILLTPRLEPVHLPRLTLMAGIAVVTAINEFSRYRAKLKWPNDILLKGKKVAGILAEYCREGGNTGVVLGVGINVNHQPSQFPDQLRGTATSLKAENGKTIPRPAVIRSVLNHLDQEYEAFLIGGETELIKKWTENSDMFGRRISVIQGNSTFSGTAVRLDALGQLVLKTGEGTERSFDSGEVTLQT